MTEKTEKAERGGPKGPRKGKLFIVSMGDETHVVKAKSATAAMKFAIAETVKVRAARASDMDFLLAYQKDNEIHEA